MELGREIPFRRSSSLRTFTALSIIISFTSVLVILGVIIYAFINSAEQQAWHERQEETAQHISLSILNLLNRGRDLFALIDLEIDRETYHELSELLQGFFSINQPVFQEVMLFDAFGSPQVNVAQAESVLSSLPNLEQGEWYSRAQSGEPYLGTLAAFGDTRPYIMLAAPLRDGGIVAGLFDRDMLDDQLAQGRLGDTGDVYLVDFDGHLLVHTQPQGILNNTPLAQRPELDAALTASNHHWHGTYTNFVGDAVIGSTAAVEGTNWIVFTEVAEAEAFATSRSAIVFLVVVLTVIEIIILFPSLLATQTNLFRPIESLRAGAEKVEQGDLNVQVKIVKADEIGEVTAAFNRMVAALRQRNTELRQARDEALAARHMAEESARLKSEFLSTMSHELRTPLNAIEGFSSIMLSGMGVELDPKAHSMVERIGANSKRLLDLINDFVDLLRIEAGRVELVEKPLSPAKLAERWASQMSVLAERKQLEFIVQVDEQLPTELLSDEDALTKITLNLLSNAFKFTHKGTVTLALRAQQEKWTIEVSDTGIGIPPHAREYIFEEFRQVDGSSKRQYGGTGLGLAIVQKMTRLMGGTVTVNSEVGQGSTFTVTLPLKMYSETA